jgi:hypothetical protein
MAQPPLASGLCALAACTEAVGYPIRNSLVVDADNVLVRVDLQNAFNSVSRTAILQAVGNRAPSLFWYVCWAYGTPSN